MKLTAFVFATGLAFAAAVPNNPLLEKNYRIPFDRIKVEHVVPAVDYLLADAQKKRDAYVANKDAPTFDNTLIAFEEITEDLGRAMVVIGHINGVATTPELRKAIDITLPKTSAFSSSLGLDAGIYARIKAYAATPEGQSLTGPRKRLLDLTMKRFRRGGVELAEAEKTRLKAMSIEAAKLSKKFSDNVLDSTNAFELVIKDEAKLAGLPQSARDAARQSARQKGVEGWRFTLQEPSYTAVMRYMDDVATREKVFRASSTKAASGSTDNRPVIARILELRRERAKLLGYKTFRPADGRAHGEIRGPRAGIPGHA
jgi:oligopeptidase A